MNAAQESTRRRHALFGGATVAVIALCGGLVYAGTSATTAKPAQHTSKLAAYDHVVGHDSVHLGRVLVVGPADEHTANCTKVPGSTVRVHHGKYFSIGVSGVSPGERIGFTLPSVLAARVTGQQPGPYYLFSCPKS